MTLPGQLGPIRHNPPARAPLEGGTRLLEEYGDGGQVERGPT